MLTAGVLKYSRVDFFLMRSAVILGVFIHSLLLLFSLKFGQSSIPVSFNVRVTGY